MIAYLRRSNFPFPAEQYYKLTAPTVSEIAHDIVQLQARNPATPIALTKRDIASAFRFLRLHPSLCLVMLTELPGKFSGVSGDADAVFIHLAMPFRRNGSPAHFAVLGDAITWIHRAHGMSGPNGHGLEPFAPRSMWMIAYL